MSKNKKVEKVDPYLDKLWVYDIETFKKCFTIVIKKFRSKEFVEFVISDYTKDLRALKKWFRKARLEKIILVGYNNVGFDQQVNEAIMEGKIKTYPEIYKFAQEVIATDSFKLPYSIFDFKIPQIDLMAINNYGFTGKATSLKWLEFSMRSPKMKDLPIPFDKETLTEAEVTKVLKYNHVDVYNTERFLEASLHLIDMRRSLVKMYKKDWWMHMANSTIGAQIVLERYCKFAKTSSKIVKKLFTIPDEIKVKKIIFPLVKFKSKAFKSVLKDFKKLVLTPEKGTYVLKGKYHKEVKFQNLDVSFALGGIHSAMKNTFIKKRKGFRILSCDVTSMYAFIAMGNGLSPTHLKKKHFKKAYGGLYDLRLEYPKPNPLNIGFKEGLNSVYGKSNAKRNNFLKDPEYTLKTTINGQLMLAMLGEQLSKIGELLMLNTDGLELEIPEENYDKYLQICNDWEKLTNVQLEHDEYEWMFIRDVNNYSAMSPSGKIKRKGFFMIYEDYKGVYDKSPSCLIVPLAINKFLIDGTPVEQTIRDHNDVYDFLYGIKGQRNFEYWFLKAKGDIVNKVDKRTERALRYYISTEGSNMFKFWKDGRAKNLQGVSTGKLVKPLMTVHRKGLIFNPKTQDSFYEDINYDFYINEAQAVINQIMYNESTESKTS